MPRHNFVKAQSLADYVVLIAIVSMGLIGMQLYMKRAVQATVKDAADDMGAGKDGLDSQRLGAYELDTQVNWDTKGKSEIRADNTGSSTVQSEYKGKTTYDREDEILQKGLLSQSIARKKDNSPVNP